MLVNLHKLVRRKFLTSSVSIILEPSQLIFGPPSLGRKVPMKLPLSLGRYVSRSAGWYVSRSVNSTADRNFLKFYMKLDGLRGKN